VERMKILVLGASQGTGALCVQQAVVQGHDVSAFARSPQKLSLEHPKLTRITGDFHDRASVEKAVAGHDAVIVTASVSKLSDFKARPDYFSRGTGYAIEAMKAHGVKRLVVLSALGTAESRPLLNFVVRTLVADGVLKEAFRDHAVQEQLAKASGLEWVIARPGRLTDGPAKGTFVKNPKLEKVPSAISRADVAAFLVEACSSSSFVRQAVQLGG
jgi:uncharacterized protein YbjT (DUF2867 family)